MSDNRVSKKITVDQNYYRPKTLISFKTSMLVILIFLRATSINLFFLNEERTLILFYASWCPHCQTIVPQVFDLYKNQKEKKFEVLAVSIDTSRADWLNFVKTNKLDWINLLDLRGWEGKVTEDYYVYATPTMFLIDKEKKIIAKPSSIEELYNWF